MRRPLPVAFRAPASQRRPRRVRAGRRSCRPPTWPIASCADGSTTPGRGRRVRERAQRHRASSSRSGSSSSRSPGTVGPTGFIGDVASWMYLNAQITVTLARARLPVPAPQQQLLLRAQHVHRRVVIALVGYTVFPTAPPRFFPEWGFVDSVSRLHRRRPRQPTANALFNPYAAVPSMHVAFALMIGIPLARLVQAPRDAHLLGALSAARHVRDRRDRQPLPRSMPSSVRVHRRPLACAAAVLRSRAVRPVWAFEHAAAWPDGRGAGARRPLAARSPASAASDAQRADRVAADAERDLDDRPRALQRRRRRPRLAAASSSSAAWRSSSARSATRSTGATRGCPGRARRSARSWTRRSTASRRASCLTAVAATSPKHGHGVAVAVCVIAVLASLMVSYTRARAEALGVECKVGIASRAVRVVILSIGLLFANGARARRLRAARGQRLRTRGAGNHHRRCSASCTFAQS